MAAHRVYQKITSPLHRSTAYDFNVHLDHVALLQQGDRISKSHDAHGDSEELGVKEHEIVVRRKGTQTLNAYNDSRLRVFSALNNLMLTDGICQDLSDDSRGVWGTTKEAAKETVKKLQDEGKGITEAKYVDSLNRVLHKHIEYVGVAITPQNLYPRGSRQDPQGFACTRGGLNTIHNTGEHTIKAGDRIYVDFAFNNPRGDNLLLQPSHYSNGIPHNKQLVQVRPESAMDNGGDSYIVNRTIEEMYMNSLERDRSGADDVLRPFTIVRRADDSVRPRAILMHGKKNVVGGYQEKCDVSVTQSDLTLDINESYLTTSRGLGMDIADSRTAAPLYIRLNDESEFEKAKERVFELDANLQVTAPTGENRTGRDVYAWVTNQIGVPIAAPDNIDDARVFKNIKKIIAGNATAGIRPGTGWADVKKEDIYASNDDEMSLTGVQTAGDVKLTANADVKFDQVNAASQTLRNAVVSGDSLTYILNVLHTARANATQNYFYGEMSTLSTFVQNIVQATLQAQRSLSRKSIGMALSGASPGEPFDIVLTES